MTVGTKADFPAAKPGDFKINQAGVFYRQPAKTSIVHLDGPAPRSLDRFALSFNGEDVVVDTQTLNFMYKRYRLRRLLEAS